MTKLYHLTVNSESTFMNCVFGADCFAARLPSLFTKGIIVGERDNGNYYTVKMVDGGLYFEGETSFFTQEEVDKCMTLELIGG